MSEKHRLKMLAVRGVKEVVMMEFSLLLILDDYAEVDDVLSEIKLLVKS